MTDGPGHRALRAGRESVAGEWYAVSAGSAGFDLRLVAQEIIAVARALEAEGLIDLCCIVVMPTHCHLLFELREACDLAGAMKRLKGRSSREANAALGRRGPLWRAAYHDHLVRTEDDARAQWWYIIENPVRAGLVDEADQYPHTYARRIGE